MANVKTSFRVGSKVGWKWAGGTIEGKIEKVYKESITKVIKGSKITRHGTPEKPAYQVKSVAGNIALKLQTELFKLEKAATSKSQKAVKTEF